MITVEPVQIPNKDSKKSKLSIKSCIFKFIILVILLALAICYFGSPTKHVEKKHKLYGVFDKSVPHQKLTNKIGKTHTVVIVGNENDGLDHYL